MRYPDRVELSTNLLVRQDVKWSEQKLGSIVNSYEQWTDSKSFTQAFEGCPRNLSKDRSTAFVHLEISTESHGSNEFIESKREKPADKVNESVVIVPRRALVAFVR